jgi:non-ribosomal peptide synthetase-like protein
MRQPSTRINSHASQITADNLCYIIYTSGTTGRPKGVEITHRSVCNYVQATENIYGIKPTDRVYQGFSIAFDASIEEIWTTFAAGATLITSSSDTVRSGAGLVEFLNKHQVTAFSCVPTLLSMLEGDVPSLQLLILGGEACPPNLITRWSRPDLRIINTYGPTETTVVSTYAEIHPEKPVTIGKPLPNTFVAILNEDLQPVSKGEVGELFIGGVGLARGYVKRPELTEKKFIKYNDQQRLYRTGDLVRLTEEEELEFIGRVDEQIKLRGFRIELSEIESVLLEFPDIRNATVTTHELTPGMQALVAYLILKPNTQLDIEKISVWLRTRLPSYMIPNLFEVVTTLPTLPSGKVDRHRMPKPHIQYEPVESIYVAPRTELEKKVTLVWEDMLKHSPISIKADFFHNLGGHSLFAAKVVSALRKFPEMQNLSMLDIYENPTIEQLTKKIEEEKLNIIKEIQTQSVPVSNLRYALCTLAQIAGCYIQFALQSWQLLIIYLVLSFIIDKYSFFSLPFLWSFLFIILGLPPILFLTTILSKWLLLGRIKPGEHRLWGGYYFRWWLAQRIQRIAPTDYLTGSPLMNVYCRLMGAKIGKNCHIGTPNIKAFDLLKIGNNTSISHNSMLLGYTVEDGWLKIGPITLGNDCFVGTRAVLNIHTTLEDDAMLEDLSMLSANSVIPKGQCYHGSPARFQKQSVINPAEKIEARETGSLLPNISYGFLHYIALMFITVIYYAMYIPGILLIDHFYVQGNLRAAIFIAAPLGAILFLLSLCLSIFIVKKILLGTLIPGSYKTKSFYYLRYWIVNRLIDNEALEAMADSLYFPYFLRMLGAKIKKHVEVGELPHVLPDLLTMQDESFTASWVFIGIPRIYNGYATFSPVTIGKRAFVGNVALLPPGTELSDGSLIGCLSVPPTDRNAVKPNTSWFGSPAVFLPQREVFAGFSENETYLPTLSLYIKRVVIEFIRIVLPSTFYFVGLVGIFLAIDFLYSNFSLLTTIMCFPLFDILIMLGLGGVAILLKWILMGKMREAIKPVWSVFIWKYDLIVHLYQQFICPAILEPLLGTPFVPFILRLLGTKIGKRAFIDTREFAEFDLIKIGNDVTLNADCIIQTHLYEDRIFKMSHIKIGDRCNVGCGSIVLYNTVMENKSSLGNLSLLMKGETLPAGSHWEGIPAQPAKR